MHGKRNYASTRINQNFRKGFLMLLNLLDRRDRYKTHANDPFGHASLKQDVSSARRLRKTIGYANEPTNSPFSDGHESECYD